MNQGNLAPHSLFSTIKHYNALSFSSFNSACILLKLCNICILYPKEMHCFHFNFITWICFSMSSAFFLSFVRYQEREKQSLMARSLPDTQVRPWQSPVKQKQFHKTPSDKTTAWTWEFRTQQDHFLTLSEHRQTKHQYWPRHKIKKKKTASLYPC